MSRKFSTSRRIRKKRNFLVAMMIYLSLGTFFFAINAASYNVYDGWWFIFPMIPLGLILAVVFAFTLGKDYAEVIAMRWEAKEQGRSMEEYIATYEEEEEDDSLVLDEAPAKKVRKKEDIFLDEDFV